MPHAHQTPVARARRRCQVATSTDYYSHGFYKYPVELDRTGELEIELVILYAALCVAHAGLRFTACKRGDGGVRQAYGNAVLNMAICALEGVVPS